MYYQDIPLFDNLPTGMSPEKLKQVINEFRQGVFEHREEFIEAHTRLATSVALRYGFYDNRGDDLIGVVMIELCKFAHIIMESGLDNDDNVIKYLLSRLHYACKSHIDVDRIFGPSRGHVNNFPETKMTRQSVAALDVPVDKPIDSVDLLLDLGQAIVTNKDELIIKMVLEGYSDREITKEFGWRSFDTVNGVVNTILKRYRLLTYDKIKVHLPYPDFRSSCNKLSFVDLKRQCNVIKEILCDVWTEHPASLMWRGCRWQLANLGLYSVDEFQRRGNKPTGLFEWFVRYRDKLSPTTNRDMPSWFDSDRLHDSHKTYLLSRNEAYYKQFGWGDEVSTDYYWPVTE